MSNKNIIAALLAFGIASAVSAELSEQQINNELKRLTQNQQFKEAQILAEQHLAYMEGNSEFDFYYGLSALQNGQYENALFSFERLSANYPQVQRYRLELARSYYMLGNLDRAEKEFNHVLASNPPEAVKENIQRFLANINTQRRQLNPRWNSSISLAAGYDSNINSATSDPTLDISLFGIPFSAQLSSDQRRMGSNFAQIRANALFNSSMNQQHAWDFGISASHKANEVTDDFDLSNAAVQSGMRWLKGASQIRTGISLGQIWLGQKSLQTDAGINVDAYWLLSQQWQPFARLQLNWITNHINSDQNTLRPQAQLGISWAGTTTSMQLTASYAQDHNLSDADYLARDTQSISWFGQYTRNKSDWYASLVWRHSLFQAPSYDLIAAGRTREEELLQALIGARYNLGSHVSAYAQYSFMQNDSNIVVYEHHRSLTEFGLTLVF